VNNMIYAKELKGKVINKVEIGNRYMQITCTDNTIIFISTTIYGYLNIHLVNGREKQGKIVVDNKLQEEYAKEIAKLQRGK